MKQKINKRPLTHAYGHWLADVQFGGFAPAFTLSLCDSEYARKPPVPIASVVMRQCKNKSYFMKELLVNMAVAVILSLLIGLLGFIANGKKLVIKKRKERNSKSYLF